MQESETERVVELWLDLVRHHRELDPKFPAPPTLRAALRVELSSIAKGTGSQGWVAELGDSLVGFVIAQVEAEPEGGPGHGPGGCWIHELYVAPHVRGSGVGSRLVEQAASFFAERGGARVSVRVEAVNHLGLRFWRARGFSERAHVLERAM